jgi:hypothetical protein
MHIREEHIQMDKKNKKKVYVIGSIIGALVTFVVIGLLVFDKGEAEKVDSIKNEKVDKNTSYEGINNLDYKVKHNEVVKLADGGYGVVFDIVSSATLSKDQLSSLEQQVFELAKRKSGKDIKSVVIHVVDSEDNYESIKSNGYKGKGLVTTVTADHSKATPVVKATHYQLIQVPELKERKIGDNEDPFAEDDGNIDAFDYDVQNAVVQGGKMTLDIVATGKPEGIADFIIGFIQVQRDLTPETKTYALNIYESSGTLKAKSPKWQYDGETLTYEEVLSVLKK